MSRKQPSTVNHRRLPHHHRSSDTALVAGVHRLDADCSSGFAAFRLLDAGA